MMLLNMASSNKKRQQQQQQQQQQQKIGTSLIGTRTFVRLLIVFLLIVNSFYWDDVRVEDNLSSSTTKQQHQEQFSSVSSLGSSSLVEQQQEQLKESRLSLSLVTSSSPSLSSPSLSLSLSSSSSSLVLPHKLSIGIFIAVDRRSQRLYSDNLRSIRCYGKRHGYDVIIMENPYYDDNDETKTDTNHTNNSTTSIDKLEEEGIVIPSFFGTNPNIKSLQDIYPSSSSSSSSSTTATLPCHSIASFSFRRQCVVTHIVQHYDFLVVLDADCGVANANITIESILSRTTLVPSPPPPPITNTTTTKSTQQQKQSISTMAYDSTAGEDQAGSSSSNHHHHHNSNNNNNNNLIYPSIIHEERFHTGEIMAASYIVQNTNFTQQYLRRWGDYYYALPPPQFWRDSNQYVHKFYHNQRDNPALNLVFLQALIQQQHQWMMSITGSSSTSAHDGNNNTTQHQQQQRRQQPMIEAVGNIDEEEQGVTNRKTTNDGTTSSSSTQYDRDDSSYSYNQSLSVVEECSLYWKLARGNPRYMTYLNCIQKGIQQIIDYTRQKQHQQQQQTLHPYLLRQYRSAKTKTTPPPPTTTTTDQQLLWLLWPNRNSPLYLFKRGHGGLGRDINTCNGKVSPMDVFVHNMKPHSSIVEYAKGFYTGRPTCDDEIDALDDDDHGHFLSSLSNWQAPVDPNRWVSIGQMKEMMKTPACMAKVTNIGDCWPDCTL
jgi:hypothetical protein